MKKLCPVCGFNGLEKAAYQESGSGSYEICPSCGFQFGVSDYDAGFSHEQWRQQWITQGMSWSSQSAPPKDWNPQKQLLNVINN